MKKSSKTPTCPTLAFLFVAACLITFAGGIAYAAPADCQGDLANKKQAVEQAEKDYDAGTATVADVIDAKVSLADTMYACGPYTKNKFCKYKQDLLKRKIDFLSGDGDGDTAAIDATKKLLEDTRIFCLNPQQ